jgi:hypothetical protein
LTEVTHCHWQDYILMVLDMFGKISGRSGFPNLVFSSREAIEDSLVESVLYLESHRNLTASITGFDWIISISLNTT